ncbi:hypothetical protein RI129_005541 [Pyrocoelia pectoralis]|uniref:Peptidase S1 domain-containing protein n=1 Tax=Pyrocoelia pectoralis TaxID=417401 RepID=A0AAN7ZLM8_9COLE
MFGQLQLSILSKTQKLFLDLSNKILCLIASNVRTSNGFRKKIIIIFLLTLYWIAKNTKWNAIEYDAKIVNGGRAVKGQFPWHANIFAYDAGTEVSKCGGSLIHPQWVLTAAHCLQIEGHPIIDLLLLFGAIDTSIKNKNVKKGYSSKWFVHHRYNTTTLYSDIGLIKLNDRMKKTGTCEGTGKKRCKVLGQMSGERTFGNGQHNATKISRGPLKNTECYLAYGLVEYRNHSISIIVVVGVNELTSHVLIKVPFLSKFENFWKIYNQLHKFSVKNNKVT